MMKKFQFILLFAYVTCTFAYKNNLAAKDELRKELHDYTGKIAQQFIVEFKNYMRTNVKSERLVELFSELNIPIEYSRSQDISDLPEAVQTTTCVLCRSLLGVMFDFRREGMSLDDMGDIAYDLCISLELQADYSCRGLVDLNLPILGYIIDNRPNLTAEVACGIVLQGSNCIISNFEPFEWTINIDPNMPAITGHKNSELVRRDDDLVIVHISDIHYDPRYFAGANANCQAAACCRTGIPAGPQDAAGRWGDFRSCDSPWEAVVDGMEQIRRQHPHIDYIYYTGDTVDHGIWETTIPLIKHIIKRVDNEFHKIFDPVPVFSILGNHESQPTNQFPPDLVPEELSQQWLYDYVANLWSRWLPSSSIETLKSKGYYSIEAGPGFRVIGINSMLCYTYNWWLLYDTKYTADNLQWLHDELLKAEQNNEKVHILTHVGSGRGDCLRVWAREYTRVIERFWNTVSGMFTGHSHRDEFNIYYSRSAPRHAINVQWNGGSATTFSHVNHNYRVYYVNREDKQIVEAESWIFNLTEANLTPDQNPRWYKSYSFKEEYGASSLTPAGLHNVVEKLAGDRELLTLYWRHKQKWADTALATGCNDNCLANHLCDTVTSVFGENWRCDELLDIFEAATSN